MGRLTTLYYRIYARYDAAAIANSIIGRGILALVGASGQVLYKMGAVEERPWFIRSRMRGVKAKMREAARRREEPFPNPADVQRISDLRIACIADEFTVNCLSPECRLLLLRADTWQSEIEGFHPHLLFVESAWAGQNGTWKWKVSVMSSELIDLVLWCRRHQVPVVFWNKEDPSHYSTFLRAAKLCDVIFTTDIDRIGDYRRDCSTSRAYLLPFAAQPTMHHPIENFPRLDAFCFAGSNYSKQEERIKTFSQFTAALMQMGDFAIYDRYLRTQDERLSFPKRYQRLIVGSLSPKEMEIAYKGYLYGVNMNTIKRSQTMFARRVMELMASNTVCLSNYSLGMRNLLGDLTISTDDAGWLTRRVKEIRADAETRDRLRLVGLTKVMEQHTYRQRLEWIFEKTFQEPLRRGGTTVAVLSDPRDERESTRIKAMFEGQRHASKHLFLLFRDGQGIVDARGLESDLADLTSKESFDLIAYFHPEDHYGPDYLRHIANATVWTDRAAIGKACYFDRDRERLVAPGMEYKEVRSIAWRRGAIRKEAVRPEALREDLRTGDLPSDDCISIDRFDYCQEPVGNEAEWADGGIAIDEGLELDEIMEVADHPERKRRLFRGESILLCEQLPRAGEKDYRALVDRLEQCRKKGPRMAIIGLSRTERPEFFMIQGMDVMLLPVEEARKLLEDNKVPVFTLGLTPAIWKLLKGLEDYRSITIIRMPAINEHDGPSRAGKGNLATDGSSKALTEDEWREVMEDRRVKVIRMRDLCASDSDDLRAQDK